MDLMFVAVRAAVVIFVLAALSPNVIAQSPVAIVEEVDGKVAGAEFMAYLTLGTTFHLSPTDRLVIGYLKSCWRETLTGGTVVIGAENSEVRGGSVERIKVRCDPGTSSTSKQTERGGAMVFRSKPGVPVPQQTIYALSPLFELKGAGPLVIKRLDQKEKPFDVVVTNEQLLRGSFLDLAKANISLTAGGIYSARVGRNQAVFKVDRSAEPEAKAIISRLVSLQPST
jgi:hypothetical protein